MRTAPSTALDGHTSVHASRLMSYAKTSARVVPFSSAPAVDVDRLAIFLARVVGDMWITRRRLLDGAF